MASKKLFISCPMRNLSDEQIKKLRQYLYEVAKAIFNESDFELIESYKSELKFNNPIDSLSESLKMLSQANYFIGVDVDETYRGCIIENMVANLYNINYILISTATISNNTGIFLNKTTRVDTDSNSTCYNNEVDGQISFDLNI